MIKFFGTLAQGRILGPIDAAFDYLFDAIENVIGKLDEIENWLFPSRHHISNTEYYIRDRSMNSSWTTEGINPNEYLEAIVGRNIDKINWQKEGF